MEYKAPELLNEYDLFNQKLNSTPDYQKMAKAVKEVGSLDGKKLQTIFSKVKSGEISADDKELKHFIEYLEVRYSVIDIKSIIKENNYLNEQFDRLQAALHKHGIFILSNGAIEDYYTDDAKAIEAKGKDNRALVIAYELDREKKLNTFLKNVHELIAPINYLVPVETGRPEGMPVSLVVEHRESVEML